MPNVAAAVALPVGSVYSGSINFGAPSSLPAGTTITDTLTNIAPPTSEVPKLSDELRQSLARRSAQSASGAIVVLSYIELLFNNAVTYSAKPSFSFTVPAAEIKTADYYVAAYDPTRPSLGWQLGFEGPAKISGTTLTFTGATTSFTFAANANYYFAVYAISTSATAPTPAPSIAPVAPTTAPPSDFVEISSGATISLALSTTASMSLVLPVVSTPTTATITTSTTPPGGLPAADGEPVLYATITPSTATSFTSGTVSGTFYSTTSLVVKGLTETSYYLSLYDGDLGAHYWLSGPNSVASDNSVTFSYTLVSPVVIKARTPYIIAISLDTGSNAAANVRRPR